MRLLLSGRVVCSCPGLSILLPPVERFDRCRLVRHGFAEPLICYSCNRPSPPSTLKKTKREGFGYTYFKLPALEFVISRTPFARGGGSCALYPSSPVVTGAGYPGCAGPGERRGPQLGAGRSLPAPSPPPCPPSAPHPSTPVWECQRCRAPVAPAGPGEGQRPPRPGPDGAALGAVREGQRVWGGEDPRARAGGPCERQQRGVKVPRVCPGRRAPLAGLGPGPEGGGGQVC